jgi:hypothetical protein
VKVKDGIEFNDHIEDVAGHVVFSHASKLGHEGIWQNEKTFRMKAEGLSVGSRLRIRTLRR